MPNSYRTSIFIGLLLCATLVLTAQEKPEFKDVVLNGKPAKLNTTTGEVTLIAQEAQKDSVSKKVEADKPKRIGSVKEYKVNEGETLLDISKRFGISLNELKSLNKLETTLIEPGQILILESTVEESEKLEDKTTISVASAPDNKSYHTVKKGETLYSISKVYGMGVEELKDLNKLTGNLIAVDQKLLVRSKAIQKTDSSKEFITIKAGDTLYSLARYYSISIEDLKKLNNLKNNTIIIGQKLRIR